jgi:hypothetical protein
VTATAERLSSTSEKNPSRSVPSGALVLIGTLLVSATVCVLRSPAIVLHPEIYAEDGATWFYAAYQVGWFHPLLTPHSGYLQTFPRLIADIGLLVPLRQLPALFVGVSMVVQVLPAVVLASRRFATVVPRLEARLLLAATYLVASNTIEVNLNLTNAQWHLGLIAVLLVLSAPPTGVGRVVDVVALVTSGLTGPFILALLPIVAIVYVVRRQRWTMVLLIMTAALTGLQLYELMTSVRDHLAPLGATFSRLVEILGGQIVGGALLGHTVVSRAPISTHWFAVSLGLAVLGVVIAALAMWSGPLELRLFNLFAVLVLAASLASPVVAQKGFQWQQLTQVDGGRYWFFPTLALFVNLLWLAGQFHHWQGAVAAGACVILAGALWFGVRTEFRYPPIPDRPNWGTEVGLFNKLPEGQTFVFTTTPPGWTMTLTKK